MPHCVIDCNHIKVSDIQMHSLPNPNDQFIKLCEKFIFYYEG